VTHDVQTLRHYLFIVVAVAAGGVTAIPIVYSFAPWWKSKLGIKFMALAVSFAITLDVTVLFQFWKPSSILVLFWTECTIFTLIAAAAWPLAWLMLRMRRPSKKGSFREE
jgi:hypothetical protein